MNQKPGKNYSMASMAGFRSWKKQQTFGGAPLSLRVGKVASDDILGSPPFPATLHTLRKTVELSCEGFFDPSDEFRVFSVAVHGGTGCHGYRGTTHLQPPPHWTLLPARKTKGNSRSQPSVAFSCQHFSGVQGCVCWNHVSFLLKNAISTDSMFGFRSAGFGTSNRPITSSNHIIHLRRNCPNSVMFYRKMCQNPFHDNVQISYYIHTVIFQKCVRAMLQMQMDDMHVPGTCYMIICI